VNEGIKKIINKKITYELPKIKCLQAALVRNKEERNRRGHPASEKNKTI
jgi:hypothetical protein